MFSLSCVCLVIFASSLDVCGSKQLSIFKDRLQKREIHGRRNNLQVEVYMNGKVKQKYNQSLPRVYSFRELDHMTLTCRRISTAKSYSIYWVQFKAGENILFGASSSSVNEHQLDMTLYNFDHESTISCIEYNQTKTTGIDILEEIEFSLYSRCNKDPCISRSTRPLNYMRAYQNVTKGTKFEKNCGEGKLLYAATSDRKIKRNYPKLFSIQREHNDMTLYCVNRSVSNSENLIITKREVTSIMKLKVEGFDNVTSEVSDKQPIGDLWLGFLYGCGIITVIIIVTVLIIVAVRYQYCTTCKKTAEPTTGEILTRNTIYNDEPVYETIDEYAATSDTQDYEEVHPIDMNRPPYPGPVEPQGNQPYIYAQPYDWRIVRLAKRRMCNRFSSKS